MESCQFEYMSGKSVFLRVWLPEGNQNLKGVILMLHGMAEHGARYDWMASMMNEKGYGFYLADLPGHGNSIGQDRPLAHIDGFKGWKEMCMITSKLIEHIEQEHKGTGLILYGHSMGSLLARLFILYNPASPNKIILTGTPYQDSLTLKMSLVLVKFLSLFYGPYKIHKGFNRIFSTTLSGKFKNDPPFSWLSTDSKLVEKYVNDPKCGFDCSLGFFEGLIKANLELIRIENKALPWQKKHFFLVSGAEDPVTHYGKSLQQVSGRYAKKNALSIETWKVDHARHEVHNEPEWKDELVKRIIDWLEKDN